MTAVSQSQPENQQGVDVGTNQTPTTATAPSSNAERLSGIALEADRDDYAIAYKAGWDAHLRLQFERARDMPNTIRKLHAELDTAVTEAAMLARQLQSITEHCDRARFGLVRTSAIYQLLITDPADKEPS